MQANNCGNRHKKRTRRRIWKNCGWQSVSPGRVPTSGTQCIVQPCGTTSSQWSARRQSVSCILLSVLWACHVGQAGGAAANLGGWWPQNTTCPGKWHIFGVETLIHVKQMIPCLHLPQSVTPWLDWETGNRENSEQGGYAGNIRDAWNWHRSQIRILKCLPTTSHCRLLVSWVLTPQWYNAWIPSWSVFK